jgi:hypothetical protein
VLTSNERSWLISAYCQHRFTREGPGSQSFQLPCCELQLEAVRWYCKCRMEQAGLGRVGCAGKFKSGGRKTIEKVVKRCDCDAVEFSAQMESAGKITGPRADHCELGGKGL